MSDTLAPTVPGPWRTVAEIRAANAAIGHHWFDPSTMRFFGSRVVPGIIGGRYFISSELPPSECRAYALRVADDRGAVATVGDFARYPTLAAARAAARALVGPGTVPAPSAQP